MLRNFLLALESDAKFGALATVWRFLFSAAAWASSFIALDKLLALEVLFLSSSALCVADIGLLELAPMDPANRDCPL